jgi:hypothetical protein
MASEQEQILAFAIYEIRKLLAPYLGNTSDADPSIRAAAHLAYALHNQADAVLQGSSFDAEQALSAVGAVDRMLATDFQGRLSQLLSRET